jgi:hypothetical protein
MPLKFFHTIIFDFFHKIHKFVIAVFEAENDIQHIMIINSGRYPPDSGFIMATHDEGKKHLK